MPYLCPWLASTFIEPLDPSGANAFNRCFLWQWLYAANGVLAVWLVVDLAMQTRRHYHGLLSPKNMGLLYYLRLFVSLVHALLWWRTSTLVGLVGVVLVTPLEAVEPLTSVIPRDVLLVYWTILIGADALVWFQQTTHYPFVAEPTSYGVWLTCVAIVAFFLEYHWWKPSSRLLYDYKKDSRLTPQLDTPNLIDSLTFCWMNKLITLLYHTSGVTAVELPHYLPANLLAAASGARFSRYYRPGGLSWRVVGALGRAFASTVVILLIYELVYTALDYIKPQLLRLLIKFFDPEASRPFLYGVLVCVAMFLSLILQTFVYNQYFLKNLELGLYCRSSLTLVVYEKALRIDRNDENKLTALGDIINLMLIDINRVQLVVQDLLLLVLAPLDLALCIALLWPLLGGAATIAGVLALAAVAPINMVIIRYSHRLLKLQMKIKDKRLKVINDILLSIKSIKLFAWEQPMTDELTDVREEELANIRKTRVVSLLAAFVWNVIPFLISFVSFATYTYFSDSPLTPETVFPALTLFLLLLGPLLQIPNTITLMVEALVALQRLNEFLSQLETEPASTEQTQAVQPYIDESLSSPSALTISVDHASFGWSKEKMLLHDICYSASPGKLHCIVGRVGSGKSLMLLAFLGHMVQEGGQVYMPASIAYCSQQPWIMNATVKENILFGHRYDPEYYQKTIDACQLTPDLEILHEGDATQVGEKGVLLSGGQKARLLLARAVYAGARVYLLDDVLSAVDSHVGNRLTEEVLLGLLRGRTIVMATNLIPLLRHADLIALLEDGHIVENKTVGGEPTPKIDALIADYGSGGNTPVPEKTPELNNDLETLPQLLRTALIETFRWDPLGRLLPVNDTVERLEKGKVKREVYLAYFRACGLAGVGIWFMVVVLLTLMLIFSNYWLKNWTERNSHEGNNGNVLTYLGVYAALGFGAALVQLGAQMLTRLWLAIRALRTVHADMVDGVLALPMGFFERNPVGRILNRFTADIQKVDVAIPVLFSMFLNTVTRTVFTIAVVGIALPPYVAVIAVLLVIYYYYEVFYVAALRELKRLVLISRSPIYAHLGELLAGRDTISAYGQVARFNFINHANIDFNIKAVYMLRLINRWLNFRLQMIGLVGVLGATILALLTVLGKHPMLPALVGFVMSYALQVTGTLKMVVRVSAEVETNVVAMERCLEYCQLPGERYEGETPRRQWPENGAIKFEHYTTRYRPELPPVLQNIDLMIAAGEKIGVVGRTGAGKSLLALAIFRILEADAGSIRIDNTATNSINLFDLRHRLSIIPQDSQLVAGTVRQNLDPFAYYRDEEVWTALEYAHLKPVIEALDDKLLHMVKEGGSNFSQGQRQLISLARVLLKMKASTSRILVLDEATALVDVETDRIIQQTIRSQFKDKTIVTIAHRLDTVMDSDKIMSLEGGNVVEFDAPAELLKSNGVFAILCKQGNYID